MQELAGKVALVSGGVEGIGWSTCQLLAERGAQVIIGGKSADERLDARIDELVGRGHTARAVALDVRNPTSIAEAMQNIFRTEGRVDIAVASAGIMRDARIGMIAEDLIADTIDVNLSGTIRLVQASARMMQRQRSGSIVAVGSIVGEQGNSGQTVYSASKAGIAGVVRSAAKELAGSGIRVNAVVPGFIETRLVAGLSAEVRTERLGNVAMGRSGRPEEVAEVIAFLASDRSSYITSQMIGVDGGMTI